MKRSSAETTTTTTTTTKKKRAVLTPVSAEAPAPAQVSVQPTVSLGGGVRSGPLGARLAEVEVVNSASSLERLLRRASEAASATEARWLRDPRAAWIAELIGELGAEARAELVALQRSQQAVGDDADFATRWELRSTFASRALELWFDGKALDAVLAKSGPETLPGGYVLSGKLADELGAKRDATVGDVASWVRALSRGKPASVFKVRSENAFHTEAGTELAAEALEQELTDRVASGRGGIGSLNTTFRYDDDDAAAAPTSGVDLLDSYHARLDEALYASTSARLNGRLYLIWKLQNYCTPHHQDVHVPPHCTLYNQVSGYSTFHFLPPLVGLYCTHVGRRRGPHALKGLLDDLRSRSVGAAATIGPKQMLLILPYGSHGVFVPDSTSTPALEPFQVSLIRAAELFLSDVVDRREAALLQDANWHTHLELTEAEKRKDDELFAAFAALQADVSDKLGLSRDDWFRLAQRMCRDWPRDSDLAS